MQEQGVKFWRQLASMAESFNYFASQAAHIPESDQVNLKAVIDEADEKWRTVRDQLRQAGTNNLMRSIEAENDIAALDKKGKRIGIKLVQDEWQEKIHDVKIDELSNDIQKEYRQKKRDLHIEKLQGKIRYHELKIKGIFAADPVTDFHSLIPDVARSNEIAIAYAKIPAVRLAAIFAPR